MGFDLARVGAGLVRVLAPHVLVHFGLNHPQQPHIRPVDVVQEIGRVSGPRLEDAPDTPVVDAHQRDIQQLPAVFGFAHIEGVALDQLRVGDDVGRDLQHGDQPHVVVGVVQVGDLTLVVGVRPVESRRGITEVVSVFGEELQSDVLVDVGAVALGAQAYRVDVAAGALVGRNVSIVADAVTVVVVVPEVGNAIPVHIQAGGQAARGNRLVRLWVGDRVRPFHTVGQTVAVAVNLERVAGPELAAHHNTLDFDPV